MRSLFRWLRGPSLAERLIRAEIEGSQKTKQPIDEASLVLDKNYVSWMTEDDMIRYRRILAKLHYGEKDADPQNEALLTQEERDNLDAYLIRKRWGQFWASQRR